MPRLRFRANSVWLNILNALTRNSVFTRSVIAFVLARARWRFVRPGPRKKLRGRP
jgi:hypothetical protein